MNLHPRRALIGALAAAVLTMPFAAQGPTFASPSIAPSGRGTTAYDKARGRLVLFNGTQTWEHDGAAWIQRTPAQSPNPRSFMWSMAYDEARCVTVIYEEGLPSGFGIHESWQWDGETWTPLPVPPRMSSSTAQRTQLVWHGGPNSGLLLVRQTPGLNSTDTWQFDGAAWQHRGSGPNTGLPDLRSLTFCPSTGRTYHYQSAWDGNGWTPVTTSGIGPFDYVWDAARGQFVGVVTDTYIGTPQGANTIFWTTLPNAALPGALPVYDSARRRLVARDATSGDLFELASSSSGPWVRRPATLPITPSPRIYMNMAYDPNAARTVLFGGRDANGGTLDDTWTFENGAWQSRGPSSAVGARLQAELVYSRSLGIVLFGGTRTIGAQWPSGTFTWTATGWLAIGGGQEPSGRDGHEMVFDSARDRIVLFGGYNAAGPLSDTHELELTWTRVSTVGSPPARMAHGMAYDARRRRVVVFGGYDTNGLFLGDTWEYDGLARTWTEVFPPQSPPRRWQPAMEYDPTRGVVVLVGGYGNPQCGNFCANHLNDVWEYDGVTWRQRTLTTTLPSGREGAAFTYDSARNRFMLQGGGSSTNPTETWYYSAAVDRLGPGMASGGTALRSRRFPMAGQELDVEFANPGAGPAWVTLSIAPQPTPALRLGVGILCGAGDIYTDLSLVVGAAGNPARLALPLPGQLAGGGLVAQGIAFDAGGNCFRVTDPLAVTVHGQ
jgi:hypothetical protein